MNAIASVPSGREKRPSSILRVCSPIRARHCPALRGERGHCTPPSPRSCAGVLRGAKVKERLRIFLFEDRNEPLRFAPGGGLLATGPIQRHLYESPSLPDGVVQFCEALLLLRVDHNPLPLRSVPLSGIAGRILRPSGRALSGSRVVLHPRRRPLFFLRLRIFGRTSLAPSQQRVVLGRFKNVSEEISVFSHDVRDASVGKRKYASGTHVSLAGPPGAFIRLESYPSSYSPVRCDWAVSPERCRTPIHIGRIGP